MKYKFQFNNFIFIYTKQLVLGLTAFFRTQKGVIDLCVRFGIKDTVSEPATRTLADLGAVMGNVYHT